jgi:hypothetical protein
MIPFLVADSVAFVIVPGDLVNGGLRCTSAELQAQLMEWQSIFAPLAEKSIGIYPVRGNHEDDAIDDLPAWNAVFSGLNELPINGPEGEQNLTYSFIHNNALCIGLDNYISIHHVNQAWLDRQLAANTLPHVFVFGHEPAFKVFHTDCLDEDSVSRNTFWQSLADARAKVYFCGHDHFYDVSRIDDGDGDTTDDLYQCLVGTGGGWLMTKFNYNGANTPYKPEGIFHIEQHGYVVVEVSGEDTGDRGVTIIWKERVFDSADSTHKYVSTSNDFHYTARPVQTSVKNEINVKDKYADAIGYADGRISLVLRQSGMVKADLFTVNGRHVQSFVNRCLASGSYNYQIKPRLTSGIYILAMRHDTAPLQRLVLSPDR